MATRPHGPFPADLEAAILELKEERNAVVLAHYYQESEVQDLADFVGDSLALAQAATRVDREVIAFCGVHFMAETAKILNPGRVVVVPDLAAGCSLADGCPPDAFRDFSAQHPDAKVVSYINTSAEIKAQSDLICTSSNAVKMVEYFAGEPIIFAPDRHLARWVEKEANRPDLIAWQATCIVHEQFSAKRLVQLKVKHPDAEVLAHPECDEVVLDEADFIASTKGIIARAVDSPAKTLIIATEDGVFHQIEQQAPDKQLIQAPAMDESCACNQCPYMRLNTLEKLYLCLRDLEPQVTLPEATRCAALVPLEKMLDLSA
ncbi:MAG: quinolinate synthase NadA [Myxococcota bacterium]|jgi:quinolinate synthase|nr:quinolinate synthase [Deltaproteobacteria bacterium]MCP4245373.1 quinolinate synthase NadA [bacterium]MDP6073425.1 quinolinate synthase NadA [Myxococcota bacterium]MDP7074464.1 quinolinate synthase NadA [Myxococcota bacterium]MDP7301432.1 quinolinate synthase NadA [Myxococcota bacterium]